MINVKDPPYNAKGNGVANDHNAIQQALNDARHNEEVYLPGGIYLVSERLNMSARKMRGEHYWRADQGGTIIKAASGFSHDEVIYAANNPCQLLDLYIDANNVCNFAVHAYKCNGASTLFSNLSAANANEYGYYIEKCQSTTFERLVARYNPVGIYAVDCNGTRFIHCVSNRNTSHGMMAKRINASAGCRIDNLISEVNGGHGLFVENVVGIIIEKCWLEGNNGDGVYLLRCRNAILERTRITGGDAADDRCVRLKHSKMCRVFNCSAAQNGHIEFLRIRDESGVGNKLDEYNARLSEIVVERLPVERV